MTHFVVDICVSLVLLFTAACFPTLPVLANMLLVSLGNLTFLRAVLFLATTLLVIFDADRASWKKKKRIQVKGRYVLR